MYNLNGFRYFRFAEAESGREMKRVIILIALLLSACGATEAEIQKAIAETESAKATNTVTETLAPSDTPTTVPTETFTPSPTPDLRVFNIDPMELLMDRNDMPVDGKYYIPNELWNGPHRNSEVVSGWGVEEGRQYLAASGRVDGWFIGYLRGTSRVLAPEEIYNSSILYSSSEGARLVMEEFSLCARAVEEDDYEVVVTDILIGEETSVCLKRTMEPSGAKIIMYLEFQYKNVIQDFYFYGWDYEVDLDMLAQVAENVLARMKELELSDSVTFKP